MSDEIKETMEITPANLEKIKEYLEQIEQLLPKGLINLTPKQRKANVKMSDKNYAFIYNGYNYAKLVPVIVPNYVSLTKMHTSLESVKSMTTVLKIMRGITSRLEDSILYEGGEVYKQALSIYKTAKIAATRNISGAKEVAAVMKKSFPGHKPKTDDGEDTE